MKSGDAIRMLEAAGFKKLHELRLHSVTCQSRRGRGSHLIMGKGNKRIVVPHPTELSPGMAGKVRSACQK